ncbi:MAG: CoA pyrophosphatase [Leptolinea sp.]|jgi:8-oxo-dGTP pyrophosphatase MutT (NUDIX family)|nr:CoA pyrophosphatase [Leptolinea sp.]
MNKSIIREFLENPEPEREIPEGNWKRAAVLAAFLPGEHGEELLFTRRTDHVLDHKGQVSFPGGAVEPHDGSIEMAALREAGEEIGIEPDEVEILGRSKDMFSNSGWWITPVIGWMERKPRFTPNPVEVSRIFTLPVDWLADPSNWEKRTYIMDGIPRHNVIYYRRYDNELLWGITAQLVHDLLQRLHLMK